MTSPNIISLKEMLKDIKDPRAKRGIRHRLSDVILIMLFATLCGYDTSTALKFMVKNMLKILKNIWNQKILRMIQFQGFLK